MTSSTTPASGTDVVDILTSDHHEVLELVAQIPPADPHQRRDMAGTVIAELMRHCVAEEMYVYPVVEDSVPDGASKVAHDKQEHQQLEEAMKALESADAADPHFLAALGQLESIPRDHVSDEENDQFPQLRATVPPDKLVQMGQQVETAKKAAPTRPHPGAPHSELFHKTVAAGVGMVDRLRDKLTGRPTSA